MADQPACKPPAPEFCTTTPHLLERAAEVYGDRIFVEDQPAENAPGVQLSFKEFRDQAHQAARALIASGFQMGDRAAIWAPNMHQWMVAALGIQCAGGILVTLNTRFKGGEAAQVLRSGEVSVLFSIGNFLGQNYPAMLVDEELPALRQLVVFDAATDAARESQTKVLWSDFVASGDKPDLQGKLDKRIQSVRPEHISDLLFTSGTTGAPKGVMTAHGQNLECFRLWTELLGLDDSDSYLVINPFFHSFGYKAGILSCLMRGTRLLPQQIFDTEAILKRIDEERISVMPGPPTLFQSILAFPERDKYDISSLIKATTGAAVIPVELITRMREDLGIDTVVTAYGLTESCGVVSMCRREDSDEIVATTSGRAIPNIELRCVNDKGEALPPGESGEIVVRGFNVMQGYYNNPQATADTIDTDGWLHTGDIGSLDEQGNLKITDRLKDMFITGGFNCYPAEIENLLAGHPDIAMSAVIGMPDERMGEVAMAWVVRLSDSKLEEAELISWCRQKMANYKVPRVVRFVDQLPLNASGKVLKTQLRAMV